MDKLSAWKKKVDQSLRQETPKELDRAVKRQLAQAVGTEHFVNRDPIYHITESFQQTFDMMGARKTAQRGNLFEQQLEPAVPGLLSGADKRIDHGEHLYGEENLTAARKRSDETGFLEKTSMDSLSKPAPVEEHAGFVNRFSQTTFNRGVMAGAVMRGTGQMMLFSCLNRTVGQSQPKNFRQRLLFQSGASMQRNVAGRPPDKVIYNRGATDSAVGLVVDVLRDARRVVDSLAELAGGDNVLPLGSGAETLQKVYPFLTDSREQALLCKYKDMLAGLGDTPQTAGRRQVLQRAALKTEALIDRKRQMRLRFMQHLRYLSDSAASAATVFNQEEFRQALHNRLADYQPAIPPPDDKGNRDNEGEQRDGERAEDI